MPSGKHAAEPHCAWAVQGAQALSTHAGVIPVHAAGSATVHCTQVFVPSRSQTSGAHSVLDAQTGEPITTEGMRYGLRAVVLGIPCDLQWRTAAGRKLVACRYFGYPVDFAPVEQQFGGGVKVVPDLALPASHASKRSDTESAKGTSIGC